MYIYLDVCCNDGEFGVVSKDVEYEYEIFEIICFNMVYIRKFVKEVVGDLLYVISCK